MSILPKFIYLIQALPIHIPPFFFKQIHALFTRFVWAHKRPRLCRTQMTLPKQYGGLALPDIHLYYLASHLGRIASKLWIQLEQSQSSIPLGGALWCYGDLSHGLKSHPLIGTTLRNSHQIAFHASLTSKNSPLFPTLGNPKFDPGLRSAEFSSLRDSGRDCAAKFVSGGKWPTISDLSNPAGVYHLPFWKAVQLHHFLHSLPDPQDFTREQMPFEALCSEDTPLAHILSQTYMLLISPATQPHLTCLASWERDLHRTFSPTQRQRISPSNPRSALKYKKLISNCLPDGT